VGQLADAQPAADQHRGPLAVLAILPAARADRRFLTHPRVVKRARHNSYRVKKPGQHGTRHDGPATIKLVNPVLARANTGIAA
jgi:hypothetical protein